MNKPKLVRVTTVSISLDLLLRGQLENLSKNFNVTAISSPDEVLLKVSKREGVDVYGVHMKRNISILIDIYSLIQLWIYFLIHKPLIIHSITPKAGLLTMLAGKFAGVPIRMHTFTGLIFPSKNGVLKKILIYTDKILCWASTNIYAEGNGVKIDITNYKITKKPIIILANGNINGINCDYFNSFNITKIEKNLLKSQLGINENDFVFLFVGRLVTDKGINELVTAFTALKKTNLKLILLGSYEHNLDPLTNKTLDIIKNSNQIITPGFQNDVRKYFSISDVFVFPSYREGFPNVVLQAAAMGLPSIVTNINGCNEIIVDQFNGIIIPSKDANVLSDSMKKLFENKEFCNYLGSNARELICKKYNHKHVWESLENEYQRLIAINNRGINF